MVGQALGQVRQAIRDAAPEAIEVISHNMPAFKLHGMLVYDLQASDGTRLRGLERHSFAFDPLSRERIRWRCSGGPLLT